MNPVIAIIAGIIVVVAVLLRWLWKQRLKKRRYICAQPLLTAAERNFYPYLQRAIEQYPHTSLCVKVRIADLVKTNPLLKKKNYYQALMSIAGKHVDYVIVDNRTWSPIVVLELDDSSHDRLDRQQRDAFVDGVFASVKLPMIHVKARRQYSMKEIRSALSPLLKASLDHQRLD